ncbi:pyridoxamine 5'-phosphate oxidase family protein [Streptomyces sp. NPDC004667]|uniref:helix-turn-helix domain-containing protein n=1 Tax=Streptomyces sp. NPDC004667 TaxID=3154285 RepID=UPI00339EA126
MPSTHPQQSGEMTARTDLGRDELGRRCGADGTYITYPEEHAASPAIGTLVRVADALGLTVDDLTGASTQRVAGRSAARRDSMLVPLDRTECRRLLNTHGVGRIAVFTPEGPAVLPVNHLVAGSDIAFRTSAEAVTTRAAGTEVAFEIDDIDDVTASGWSVLAVGEPAAVTDPHEVHHPNTTARSRPRAGGPRDHRMKLTPVRITGRRVVHD